MKKIKLVALFILLLVVCEATIKAKEYDNKYGEPMKIRCTCYTASEGSITADGWKVREGIISGKKEWLGYTAILYDMDMNLIGIFEFKDTGGHHTLVNGTSVDVFRYTLDDCFDWIETYGDYVYIQIVKAEG